MFAPCKSVAEMVASLPKRSPFFKIASWNVNGLRALLNKNREWVDAYVQAEDPDVFCLNETKADLASIAKEVPKDFLSGYKVQWESGTEKGTRPPVNLILVTLSICIRHLLSILQC